MEHQYATVWMSHFLYVDAKANSLMQFRGHGDWIAERATTHNWTRRLIHNSEQ
jgi:hypothetical protein